MNPEGLQGLMQHLPTFLAGAGLRDVTSQLHKVMSLLGGGGPAQKGAKGSAAATAGPAAAPQQMPVPQAMPSGPGAGAGPPGMGQLHDVPGQIDPAIILQILALQQRGQG